MKITITGMVLTAHREPGDKAFGSESTLLHHIKVALIQAGVDAIKKRMWKDGHLVSDYCQYVRTRKYDGETVGFAIWHERYAIEDAKHEFNVNGKVSYQVAGNVPPAIRAKFSPVEVGQK